MAGDKIDATARTAPIDGVDSENASLNVGSRAPQKQNTLENCRPSPFMILGS